MFKKIIKIFFLVPIFLFSVLEINAATFNEDEINTSTSNRIHFLPVLGDAILLESNGQYALIDGGEDSDNPRELPDLSIDGYENFVVDYIKQIAGDENGKVILEFIIGTHAHSDHLGGLDTVVNDSNIYVKKDI